MPGFKPEEGTGGRRPIFSKCLCCSNRVGCLVVGWLYSILTFIAICVFSYFLSQVDNLKIEGDPNGQLKYLLTIIFGIGIGVCVITFLCMVLLLVGTYKRSPTILMAFIITFGIVIGLTALGAIINFVSGAAFKNVVQSIVQVIIGVLICIMAHSHKTELQNGAASAYGMT